MLVDHAEGLFTLPATGAERDALVTALCELARDRLVLLALRADCYGQATGYPGLLRALQERQVVLGPMNAGQLRRAVTEPALLAGAELSGDLVTTLLADLAPAVPDGEPGQGSEPAGGDAERALQAAALPLAAHALLAAWRRGSDEAVSLADYLAAGGTADALAHSAERAYHGLSAEQQDVARLLLPELTHQAAGQPPTRVAAPLSELRRTATEAGAKVADADRALAAFAGEGLVTVDAGHALLTHDAVLTAWPRLRDWARRRRRVRPRRAPGRGRPAAGPRHQDGAGAPGRARPPGGPRHRRGTGAVPRAGDASAEDGAGTGRRPGSGRPVAGPRPGRAVRVGTSRRGRRAHRARAGRRGPRGLRVLPAAARGHGRAGGHRERPGGRLPRGRDRGGARRRGSDPATAAQLATAAYAIAGTPQATGTLLDASAAAAVTRVTDGPSAVRAVSVSPDGRLLIAAADDGSLQLWNIATPARPALVATLTQPQQQGAMDAAAFSPSGTVIAAGGQGQTIQLWQVNQPGGTPAVTAVGAPLTGPHGRVSAVAVSSDRHVLAAGHRGRPGSGCGRSPAWRARRRTASRSTRAPR